MKKENSIVIVIILLAAAAVIIAGNIHYDRFIARRPEVTVASDDTYITVSTETIEQTVTAECLVSGNVLPESIEFDAEHDFSTPYGTFTPIDKVLEMNAYMVCNPVKLTSEQSLCYITPDRDEKKAEEVMERIKALSDEICAGITDDTEKVKAICLWVGMNVAYDRDAAEDSVDLSVTSLEAVLDNGLRTTCEGFSNLFAALCHCQGIYVLNMHGGSSSEGWSRAQLAEAPANHSWAAAFTDGSWHFCDPTWISDLAYEDGVISGGERCLDFYAMFGFEEMSIEHRIDRCEHRCFDVLQIND